MVNRPIRPPKHQHASITIVSMSSMLTLVFTVAQSTAVQPRVAAITAVVSFQ